jgi:hypothetical protein
VPLFSGHCRSVAKSKTAPSISAQLKAPYIIVGKVTNEERMITLHPPQRQEMQGE